MTIALLSLIGILIALYLTLYKVGVVGDLSCSIGSCETVNTSRWATFLGLPVAAWGLATYIALFTLAMVGTGERFAASATISWSLVALSGWSVLFSGWLTYLELFVIHAICIWCVASAVVMVVIFGLSLADLRGARGRGVAGAGGRGVAGSRDQGIAGTGTDATGRPSTP